MAVKIKGEDSEHMEEEFEVAMYQLYIIPSHLRNYPRKNVQAVLHGPEFWLPKSTNRNCYISHSRNADL